MVTIGSLCGIMLLSELETSVTPPFSECTYNVSKDVSLSRIIYLHMGHSMEI